MSEHRTPTAPHRKARRTKSPAQAMVEFGLALPILLLIVYGLIETGRLIFIYASVVTAARTAVRYGSVSGDNGSGTPYYADCPGIRASAQRLGFIQRFRTSDITIAYDNGPGTAEVGGNDCVLDAGHPTKGDRIRVQVTAPFSPILPFVPFESFPITSTANRTLLIGVHVEVDSPGSTVDTTSGFLTVVKSSNPTSFDTLGQTITYYYQITNMGTDPIDSIMAVDDRVTAGGGTVTCPGTVLAGAASMVCQATYAITQTDIDNQSVTNTVTVTGLTLGVTPNVAETSLTLNFVPRPALALAKDHDPITVVADGTPVTYIFTVTNTGNVPLTDFAIQDDHVGTTWDCTAANATPLDPGLSANCSGTYVMRNSDISHGSIVNTATATGKFNAFTVTSNVATDTVFLPPLLLDLTTSTPSQVSTLGTTITYRYTILNRTLRSKSFVTVSDTRGATKWSCPAWWLINPGASATCTRTYSAYTQADMDSGAVRNQAQAKASGGQTSNTAYFDVSVLQTITLSLTKTASVSSALSVGAPITYKYKITNTGNVTLTPPYTVVDDRIPGIDCTAASSSGSLAANGGQKSCADKLYLVTAADINAGSIVNKATASAMFGTTKYSSPVASATVITFAEKRLGILKVANPSSFSQSTTTITYTFGLVNTGGQEIAGPFSIIDPKVPVYTCQPGPIPIGGWIACTGTYTLTAADRLLSSISNSATATAENGTLASTLPNPGVATITQFSCNPALLHHNNPSGIPVGSDVTWTLVNDTGQAVHIQSIVIRWGSAPPYLIQVLLGGTGIWNGPTSASYGGFTVPGGPWLLPTGNTDMRLKFSAVASAIHVSVSFVEPECQPVDSGNVNLP